MAEDDRNEQTDARLRRALRASQAAGTQRNKKHRFDWTGESAAIYCLISHVNDDDQTGVERQERICRDVAERLGLIVAEDQVYVDNNRSAWQRKRKRPGWDALLAQAAEGRVRHVLTYHPDRLMRQPRDLEELLQIADDHDITLHGQANRRDLADPDDRFFLRIKASGALASLAPWPGVRPSAGPGRAPDRHAPTAARRAGSYDATGRRLATGMSNAGRHGAKRNGRRYGRGQHRIAPLRCPTSGQTDDRLSSCRTSRSPRVPNRGPIHHFGQPPHDVYRAEQPYSSVALSIGIRHHAQFP